MTPSDKLREASARLTQAVAACDKISQAIARVSIEVAPTDELRAEVDRLQLDLETASAEVALGTGVESTVAEARLALQGANERLQAVLTITSRDAVARAGLERKLAEADAGVIDATEAVRAAEIEFLTDELMSHDREFISVGKELAIIARRMLACGLEIQARGARLHPSVRLQELEVFSNGPYPVGPESYAECTTNHKGRYHDGFRMFPAPPSADSRRDLLAEMSSIAQDYGLINRVRKVISNAMAA